MLPGYWRRRVITTQSFIFSHDITLLLYFKVKSITERKHELFMFSEREHGLNVLKNPVLEEKEESFHPDRTWYISSP